MGQSTRQRKEILLSNGIYRTLARVESFLLRDRLLLRTGRSGREILHQATRAMPDAVLLEHVLSDLSAPEICTALRRLASSHRPPVIIVAGPARPRDVAAECLAAGCDRYITSRRSPARILTEICRALHMRDRRHRRLPAAIPVAVGRVASEFLGHSLDLSEGGVLVASDLSVKRGARMRLRLYLRDGDPPLIADAVVRRCAAGPEEDQHLLGMEFVELDRASGQRLGDHLKALGEG
jgi:CheY-like chemotaxis protein